ncbi:interleukin-10 isoform X2 [Tachyglossus aculeatus]|uniref:interleukin-10 isoform X2 n=1 Tax=Tachyglossus aculeatus TaxID=9261 RepID=UPI0018F34EAF|nr:interleukin-10 isoform X2 [Tachyglossus aculeatus]
MHHLLLLLSLVCIFSTEPAWGQNPPSAENCVSLPDTLPTMLRELRSTFKEVKNYFKKDDRLDTILLKADLLEDFKSYLGCQALSDMIRFYLEEVMPRAEKTEEIKRHVGSLGKKLQSLQHQLKRCHRFLPCEKKSKAIEEIKKTYDQLKDQGMYKAMGEFDIFINYMETYLMLKIQK